MAGSRGFEIPGRSRIPKDEGEMIRGFGDWKFPRVTPTCQKMATL